LGFIARFPLAKKYRDALVLIFLVSLLCVIALSVLKAIGLSVDIVERLADLVVRIEGLPGFTYVGALDLVLVLLVAIFSLSTTLLSDATRVVERWLRTMWPAIMDQPSPEDSDTAQTPNSSPTAPPLSWAPITILGALVASAAAVRVDSLL
jgi:hypothetical protein